MLETILTARGSWEGTCGINTSRMKRKNNTVNPRSINMPFFETRGWGEGFSDILITMFANKIRSNQTSKEGRALEVSDF
jgi:hypothetical protein